MLKKLHLSFFLIALSFASVYAQDSKKVLFLGNSYTAVNNLPSMLSDMVESTGDELIYDGNTPGGTRFMNHAVSTTSLDKINAEDWDYVVLQAQSQETSLSETQMQDELYPYAESLSDAIRANNACSQPLFYMTWGRENGEPNNCPYLPWVCEYETMDDVIRETYIFMAEENDALLAPAGAVWRELRTNNPTIDLYASDGSHPSKAGSYAAACALYTMIYKKDPTLVTWESTLSAADAETIRETAKSIVFDVIQDWDYTLNPAEADFNETITDGEVSFTNTSADYDSLVWDFGDSNTSTDDSPVHTYEESGEYTVTLTVTQCDQTDVKTKTINVEVLGVAVFDEVKLSMYPNPVKNNLTLDFGKSFQQIECTLIDVTGRILFQKSYTNQTRMSLDFSSFPQGVYFVKLVGERQVFTRKIVKE